MFGIQNIFRLRELIDPVPQLMFNFIMQICEIKLYIRYSAGRKTVTDKRGVINSVVVGWSIS